MTDGLASGWWSHVSDMPMDDLLARLRDDADYLQSGHRPASLESAVQMGREIMELVSRVEWLIKSLPEQPK